MGFWKELGFGGDEDKYPNLHHSLLYKKEVLEGLFKKDFLAFWEEKLCWIFRRIRTLKIGRNLWLGKEWKLTWRIVLVTCEEKLCKYDLISFFFHLQFILLLFWLFEDIYLLGVDNGGHTLDCWLYYSSYLGFLFLDSFCYSCSSNKLFNLWIDWLYNSFWGLFNLILVFFGYFYPYLQAHWSNLMLFFKVFFIDFKIKFESHKVFVYLPKRFSIEMAFWNLFWPFFLFFFQIRLENLFLNPLWLRFQVFLMVNFMAQRQAFFHRLWFYFYAWENW